jgi:hypothetical protein
LIQDGVILQIDSPEAIIKQYPKSIYNVRADNMYQLIQSLKAYEHSHSVYPFGEFVHYTDRRTGFNPVDLKLYLAERQLANITIELTQPTIEDAFMELAK